VLRLWRDLYRVVLQPGQVSLHRIARGRVSKATDMSVAVDVRLGESPSWRGALFELEQIVSGMNSEKFDVEVVLSNHFVRYDILPWSDALLDADESMAMAAIRFEEVYGERAAGWDVRLSDAGYGESRMACAIDHELVEGLSEVFGKTSLKLISIQPFLMSAFNQCREQLQERSFLLLLEEPGRIGLAQVKDGQWFRIRTMPVNESADELPVLLRREVLQNGLDESIRQYRFDLSYLKEHSTTEDWRTLLLQKAPGQPEISAEAAQC